MESKMKRSLYFTKTFLFSLLLYVSCVYQPIVNYLYEGKLTKDDATALFIGTFSFFGITGSRARVNDDIRLSAETGVPTGLVSTRVIPNKKV